MQSIDKSEIISINEFERVSGINGLKEQILHIKGSSYTIYSKSNKNIVSDAPRLIIVSHLTSPDSILLLRTCIETVVKYTDSPHEIWVVDNNSPMENLAWLSQFENINYAFSRTTPVGNSDYSGAVCLEIGRRVISPDSEYLVSLQQDTMVCRYGWLSYLKKRLEGSTRAILFHKVTCRQQDGDVQIPVCMLDLELIEDLGFDCFPGLSDFDVGGSLLEGIINGGFEIYTMPNTLRDHNLVSELPSFPPYKELNACLSLSEDGDVVFAHRKSEAHDSDGNNDGWVQSDSAEVWVNFFKTYLLGETNVVTGSYGDFIERVANVRFYSIRRYYVDLFFENNIELLHDGASILDMGGKKERKRGFFDIGNYHDDVVYANVDRVTNPDYLCDICDIPVPSSCYDGVILAEVLEHISKPMEVLQEAFRLLKPGGLLLLTVPFTYHIHGDPDDYGRYTPSWYRQALTEIGFREIYIEKHGLFFLVLANMFGLWFQQQILTGHLTSKFRSDLIYKFLNLFRQKAFVWDARKLNQTNLVFSGYTTGFGLVVKK